MGRIARWSSRAVRSIGAGERNIPDVVVLAVVVVVCFHRRRRFEKKRKRKTAAFRLFCVQVIGSTLLLSANTQSSVNSQAQLQPVSQLEPSSSAYSAAV